MKKIKVLIVGIGLSLSLITVDFETSMAQVDTALSGLNLPSGNSQLVDGTQSKQVKKNFIYMKPDPVKPDKIATEFFVGLAGGVLIGVIGLWPGGSGGGPSTAAGGYLIASSIGSTLGVKLIGNTNGERGSGLATLGGSLAGSLMAYQIVKHSHSPLLWLALFNPLQAAGATVGFNLTRKKKVEVPSGALLNLSEGRLSMVFPQVNLSLDSKSSSSYKVNLFQANF